MWKSANTSYFSLQSTKFCGLQFGSVGLRNAYRQGIFSHCFGAPWPDPETREMRGEDEKQQQADRRKGRWPDARVDRDWGRARIDAESAQFGKAVTWKISAFYSKQICREQMLVIPMHSKSTFRSEISRSLLVLDCPKEIRKNAN